MIYIYLIYIYEKSFLLGAIAVAALASCSNDDVVDVNKGEGISFRASLDKALNPCQRDKPAKSASVQCDGHRQRCHLFHKSGCHVYR